MKSKINVNGTEVSIISKGKEDDFISLTDIAKYKNADDPRFVIQNWMRNRFTIEFMGFWEQLYNPDFNRVEFDAVRNESGSNAFASEADLLNVALFGKTAKEWKEENPDAKGNMRDDANIQQLIVPSNLESMNAELIKRNMPQSERLLVLNKMAIEQMTSILGCSSVRELGVER